MKGLAIPLAMALVGAGLGAGAAFALKPGAAPGSQTDDDGHGARQADDHGAEADAGHGDEGEAKDDGHGSGDGGEGDHGQGEAAGGSEFLRLNNQFVIPVIEDGRTRALVMMVLTLDVAPGSQDAVYAKEPRVRDAILRVLFDHANTGGFSGAFTRPDRIEPLRAALVEQSRAILGSTLNDVLITDVARQET